MAILLEVIIDGDVSQTLDRSLGQGDAEGVLKYPYSFPEIQELLLPLRDNGRIGYERGDRERLERNHL